MAKIKTTDKQEFRITVANLLDKNEKNIGIWLEKVANGNVDKGIRPDPARALEILLGLAEFVAPKLSRAEFVGENGGPIQIDHIMRPQLSKAEWLQAHNIEVLEADVKRLDE